MEEIIDVIESYIEDDWKDGVHTKYPDLIKGSNGKFYWKKARTFNIPAGLYTSFLPLYTSDSWKEITFPFDPNEVREDYYLYDIDQLDTAQFETNSEDKKFSTQVMTNPFKAYMWLEKATIIYREGYNPYTYEKNLDFWQLTEEEKSLVDNSIEAFRLFESIVGNRNYTKFIEYMLMNMSEFGNHLLEYSLSEEEFNMNIECDNFEFNNSNSSVNNILELYKDINDNLILQLKNKYSINQLLNLYRLSKK